MSDLVVLDEPVAVGALSAMDVAEIRQRQIIAADLDRQIEEHDGKARNLRLLRAIVAQEASTYLHGALDRQGLDMHHRYRLDEATGQVSMVAQSVPDEAVKEVAT